MDAKLGLCWRCNKDLVETVTCSVCEKPKYCNESCRAKDNYRHQAECEDWEPKKCGNPTCLHKSKKCTTACSACCCIWYCSKTCQQQDWNNHKTLCKSRRRSIQTVVEPLRQRFERHKGNPLEVPYYIGNSLAVDMLNLPNNELSIEQADRPQRDYSILSVGCGNLRDVIHTAASLPDVFKGKVTATLNDIDPCLQARNMLFVFMMSATIAGGIDIASMITSIWYSLYLSKTQYDFVVDCLKKLLSDSSYDSTRSSTDIDWMFLIRKTWTIWLGLECQRDYDGCINVDEQRQKIFSSAARDVQQYREQLPQELRKSFDYWLRTGAFQPRSCKPNDLKYVNPTLTWIQIPTFACSDSELKNQFAYCIDFDLMPYGEWDHVQVMQYLSTEANIPKSLTEMYHMYITYQIKQAMICMGTRQLHIDIITCDCLKLPNTFGILKQFDRIFTSNMADYVGVKMLLRVFKSFLNHRNKFAVIITRNMNWFLKDRFPQARVTAECNQHEFPNCFSNAVKDTGKRLLASALFSQEYFNNTNWFVSYLRADYMACSNTPCETYTSVVSFNDVKNSEGLRMRDFRYNLNKVVPFRYRRNIRLVNLKSGLRRSVEWGIPWQE